MVLFAIHWQPALDNSALMPLKPTSRAFCISNKGVKVMFTGIVEERGKVRRLTRRSAHAFEIEVEAEKVLNDMKLGDSIAINGVCLTVTELKGRSFHADIMPETFFATNLAILSAGSYVNLERAMVADGRFGGHFVSGHVDGTARILNRKEQENAILFDISIPEGYAEFFLLKGSITIDGISLTLFKVKSESFQISIIPHTATATTLGNKHKGDHVNIECDLLAKHIWHMMNKTTSSNSSDLTYEKLAGAGFMQGGQ